jgi:predicted lipid-binding transport protein (Tim44 family)
MKEKIGQILFTITAIAQTILHYLGLLGILLGVIAWITGNKTGRVSELLIGGIGFLILKYVIGFVSLLIIRIFKLSDERKN